MGIEDYLLTRTTYSIQGQRLVRKICQACKVLDDSVNRDSIKELSNYIPEDATLYRGKGCAVCNNSGYSGREMICEVLLISDKLSTMIANGASRDD